MRAALAVGSVLSVLATSAPHHRATLIERVVANDNRVPAGVLKNGVLTISLEARDGEWHPDAESARGVGVRAFAEKGKQLSAPGPLIRVPEGTEIHASVTNRLPDPILLRGFVTRTDVATPDTARIGAGETREFRFVAGKAGTYYYSASAGSRTVRNDTDGELNGAFIIDQPGAPRIANDRVFVITLWDTARTAGAINNADFITRFAINGKAWPNTERLAYTVGDTARIRIINTSIAVHPMHLHGFYYDVTSRGDGTVDSIYAKGEPPYRVVTERTASGRTFTMSWVPERAGNWLLHCHDNVHVTRNDPLDGTLLPPEHLVHQTNHLTDMMGGLVMGITVRERGAPRTVALASAPRRLRLVAQVENGGTELEPDYGFVLQEGAKSSRTAAPLLPGPVIVVERGKPVSITVVNQLKEATSVHWHGIELDSYFDGVPDFSGAGQRVARAIAPGDSFNARFTPPRSGTFIYHPHADEVRQFQAGLTGVLLVVDDAAAWDPSHDFPLLITTPRRATDGGQVFINGSLTPHAIDMKVGERYRLRVVNIHTSRPSMIARVVRDSALMTWRPIAKDGMDLPPQRTVARPAQVQLGNGETYDFEVIPTQPGELRFTVTSAVQVPLGAVAIHVRP